MIKCANQKCVSYDKTRSHSCDSWVAVLHKKCGFIEAKEPSDEPLTPVQRVDRLFDETDFPTYEDIVGVICDAEFDTLNFPRAIAKRHGQ